MIRIVWDARIKYSLIRAFSSLKPISFKELISSLSNPKTEKQPKKALLSTIEKVAENDSDSLAPVLSLLSQQYFTVQDKRPVGYSNDILCQLLSSVTSEPISYYKEQLHTSKSISHLVAKCYPMNTQTQSELTCLDVLENIKKISLISGTESEKKVVTLLSNIYNQLSSYNEIYYFTAFFLKAPIGFSEKRVFDSLSTFYFNKYLDNKNCGSYSNLQEGKDIIKLLDFITNKEQEIALYNHLIKRNRISRSSIKNLYYNYYKALTEIAYYCYPDIVHFNDYLESACNFSEINSDSLSEQKKSAQSLYPNYYKVMSYLQGNLNIRIGIPVSSHLALPFQMLPQQSEPFIENKSALTALRKKGDFISYKEYYYTCQCLQLLFQYTFINKDSNIEDQYNTSYHHLIESQIHKIDDHHDQQNGLYIERKYDGFRVQIHKEYDHYYVFGRNGNRLKGIEDYISKNIAKCEIPNSPNYVVDGECICINKESNEIIPFQDIGKYSNQINVSFPDYIEPQVKLFDILLYNNNLLINKPLTYRKEKLKSVFNSTSKLIEVINGYFIDLGSSFNSITSTLTEEMSNALQEGTEGLMIKLSNSPYNCGQRNYKWIKIKKNYYTNIGDTFDVVIMGYDYGKGTRVDLPGSFLVGILDIQTNLITSLCKIGTGFSQNDLIYMKENLESYKISYIEAMTYYNITKQNHPDVWVKPEKIIEIKGQDILKSTSYTSSSYDLNDKNYTGLTLRFPSFKRFRDDKLLKDILTNQALYLMYKNSRIFTQKKEDHHKTENEYLF